MNGLAPRAPGDSVRPRRLSGVVVRPLNFTVRRPMSTRARLNVSANDLAVGGLVLFVTLVCLWTLTAVLSIPFGRPAPRLWVMAVVAPLILLGATAYLRDRSLLWQVPMQALALACLIVAVRVLI